MAGRIAEKLWEENDGYCNHEAVFFRVVGNIDALSISMLTSYGAVLVEVWQKPMMIQCHFSCLCGQFQQERNRIAASWLNISTSTICNRRSMVCDWLQCSTYRWKLGALTNAGWGLDTMCSSGRPYRKQNLLPAGTAWVCHKHTIC